jgi:trans-aconitate methyltransferase
VHETPEQILIEMLAPRPGERVLDAGCGLGRWTAALTATGASLTGIDLHAPLLEQARLACPAAEFHAADLLTWTAPQPFDAIYAFATLHWIQPPLAAARALYALLRPGGRLAAAFGGLSAVARELKGCYQPAPRDYQSVLERAGFAMLELRPGDSHFFVLARREK